MLNDSRKVKILLIVAVIVLALIAGFGKHTFTNKRGDVKAGTLHTLVQA